MLGDEVRGLLQKQGVIVVETESQTYALLSGDTQSLTTLVLKTPAEQKKDQMECATYIFWVHRKAKQKCSLM
jgi:hypothetical protein